MAHSPSAETVENVRLALTRRRRSGRQLAEAVGWSAGTVSRKLRHESPLTVDELYAAASFLDVDPAELLPNRGLRELELAAAS